MTGAPVAASAERRARTACPPRQLAVNRARRYRDLELTLNPPASLPLEFINGHFGA
jgi:hypothetical protein